MELKPSRELMSYCFWSGTALYKSLKTKKQKEINALITVDVRSRNWGISRGVYTRIFHICWGIFDHCQDRSHAMIIDV